MITDFLNTFGDADTLVGTAASTYVLGDVIDTEALSRDLSLPNLRARCQIETTVLAAGGAANVTFNLVSDSVATLDNSPTVHYATAAIAKGTLVAGYTVFDIALPAGVYERYLGITYTPDTNDITAGKADAFLAPETKNTRDYTATA